VIDARAAAFHVRDDSATARRSLMSRCWHTSCMQQTNTSELYCSWHADNAFWCGMQCKDNVAYQLDVEVCVLCNGWMHGTSPRGRPWLYMCLKRTFRS
jgi:hypothetical protein